MRVKIGNLLRAPSIRAVLFGMILATATIFAYHPAWHGDFIWDDDEYVTKNPLLTAPDGLRRIWFSLDSPSQYFPLVYTTFRIERALWGLEPTGYHWTNIFLHVTNALLAWRLLARLKVPGAALAAAIFALHPVQVESVAWITERKNVLMGVFFLLTLLAWNNFVEARDRRRGIHYGLALLSCAFALSSKSTACTLPAALFLILWIKRRPVDWRRFLQILPFALLGLGMGVVAVWWERYHQGTHGKIFEIGVIERVLIASRAIWFYTWKLVWPTALTFSYPRWNVSASDPLAYSWLLICAACCAAIYFARRYVGRSVEVAAVFFVATLSPMLGFIMLYTFRYTFVADHYQYIASLGPIALAAVGMNKVPVLSGERKAILRGILCAGLLSLLFVLTWRQSGMYANSETIWRTTIARNSHSSMAHNNLGLVLLSRGAADEAFSQFESAKSHTNLGVVLASKGLADEAFSQFRTALEIDPNDPKAHHNLGNVLLQRGQLDEGIGHFRRALMIDPNYPEAHNSLGTAQLGKGEVDAAIDHFKAAIKLQPGYAQAHNNLAVALLQKGQTEAAIEQYDAALKIDPTSVMSHGNLANVLLQKGRQAEGIAHFEKALQFQPDAPEAHNNLGILLSLKGRTDEAIVHFQEALKLNPRYPEAHNNLGNAFLAKNQIVEATSHYQSAAELNPQYADAYNNLGYAFVKQGQLEEGIRYYEKALNLKPDYLQARYNLGCAFLQVGQRAAAMDNFEEALRLKPDYAEAKQQLRALGVQVSD